MEYRTLAARFRRGDALTLAELFALEDAALEAGNYRLVVEVGKALEASR